MRGFFCVLALSLILFAGAAAAGQDFETDIIKTASGDLKITFIGHGSLVFEYGSQLIHVDPWSKLADYGKLPKADIILVSHDHFDHLDLQAIAALGREKTVVVVNRTAAAQLKWARKLENNESLTVNGVKIEAVPAYNLVHKRPDGQFFHPRGDGNGYVLSFGDKRVYVAGDTENIPEMSKLGKIDIAFLPMNLPYTMTPEMAADAARSLRPAILYPYHFGESDTARLAELLKDDSAIELRIRKMP